MTPLIRAERGGRQERIGLITIEHPPVNALSQPVRAALLEALEAFEADPAIRGIVIHGAGKVFVAGADVREFDANPRAPLLNDLLLRLEQLTKPVVAALHGPVLGGGAELALASHYRAAAADLSFGFPEIKLGLLPGAGGCVRLPRMVDTRTALDLMLTGEPIGLARAQALGLVDHVLAGDPRDGAIAYADSLIDAGCGPRRTCERAAPGQEALDVCKAARAELPRAARHVPAGRLIVEAVELAASQPFGPAIAHARTLFETCRGSPESQALRHLFFAERRRLVYAAKPRPVARVGVVGAGTMGSGIAISLVTAGYATWLVDSNPDGLIAGEARVGAALQSAVLKGRLTAVAAEEARARLHLATELAALREADLVIEAVFESLDLKRQIFASLGQLTRPEAVLATNTSTLDVDAIARASGRPGSVVGMHFFSPANVMRLVEIVRGTESAESALAVAAEVTRRMGKIAVEVGNAFGFVGNRMLYAYGREKERMLLEGALPEQIDRALENFGMAMGPNAVNDLAGLDVGYSVRREWAGKPDDPTYFRAADRLVETGRLGRKTGRGFYRYVDGDRVADPEVAQLIREQAERLGIAQRRHDDAEIIERCVFALINEGARLLESAVARSAADIDVIWCNGYGFPRWRGGPMHYADTLGLANVHAGLNALARTHGAQYFPVTSLIAELAATGGSFAAHDALRDRDDDRRSDR
jgi:3-hydroxyacyl-CoA dehydrogenase